jgi:hypothetical protein
MPTPIDFFDLGVSGQFFARIAQDDYNYEKFNLKIGEGMAS